MYMHIYIYTCIYICITYKYLFFILYARVRHIQYLTIYIYIYMYISRMCTMCVGVSYTVSFVYACTREHARARVYQSIVSVLSTGQAT